MPQVQPVAAEKWKIVAGQAACGADPYQNTNQASASGKQRLMLTADYQFPPQPSP